MTLKPNTAALATVIAIVAGGAIFAHGPHFPEFKRFSDFTPLETSAGPTTDESHPIIFGNPRIHQESIADRETQLAQGFPNTGSWDMITVNETRPHKGRYLFTVFETGQAGVQRHDRWTGTTETIWMSPAPGAHVAFDPSFWTPWGTLVTGEESWCTAAAGCTTSPYGRMFELRNPIEAPGMVGPPSDAANAGADFVHVNIIPRTSHEGLQWDGDGNMYFVDELNGGNIYRYVPKAPFRQVLARKADYFAAGQTFVLRVGDGNTPNAVGPFTWVPITDPKGQPLPGAITITDPNGVTSVDARNTTNLAAFKGTDYQRPEDLQIQTVRGRQYLYVTTTTTNEVYRLDLDRRRISTFVNRNSIDLATGAPVGEALGNVDNLAIDHDGNVYVVEDFDGGVADDIWLPVDLNHDGDVTDKGEGIGRWATNGTVGSEFTGLYFDPFDKRRAWVNIQHPDSGNDRTIELTLP